MKRFRKLIHHIQNKRKAHQLPLQTMAAEGTKRVNELSDAEIRERMKRINADFRHAFKLMKEYQNTVTFFGSSMLPTTSPYYHQARKLAHQLVDQLDVAIVSGAGPGIMEAANRGAYDAKGDSVGYAIELPKEQTTNPYATHHADFYYFFSRKVALTFTARAYVFFPGGYGTLDELFEILTLKETGKIPALPVILVGSPYWNPLIKFLEETVYEKTKALTKSDLSLYTLTDDLDEVVSIIASKSI
jgi:uncharacterized protein (TIGR00730 family)